MYSAHINNQLIAIIEKKLSAAEQARAEGHLASCESCKALLAKATQAYTSFDSIPCPDVSPYFYSAVLLRLQNAADREFILPVPLVRSLKPFAAGLVVLTFVTFSVCFGKYFVSQRLSSSETHLSNATAWANEYYLDNSDDTMLDIIINSEK